MTRLSIKRGKGKASRCGSRRRRGITLPRLARWAGVGVFVFRGVLSSCDGGGTETTPKYDYVYAGIMVEGEEIVHKLRADNGEKVFGFGATLGGLHLDVDPRNGDVYVYTWDCLSKYSKDGKLLYKVKVDTGWTNDWMVFDKKRDVVWILDARDGDITGYRGDDGSKEFTFQTDLTLPDQPVLDEEEDVLWVVGYGGVIVARFSPGGEKLFEFKGNQSLGPMALDKANDALVFRWYEREGARFLKIKRYSKKGPHLNDFPVKLSYITAIAVEPTTGVIWVSDGHKSERYTPAGKSFKRNKQRLEDTGERISGKVGVFFLRKGISSVYLGFDTNLHVPRYVPSCLGRDTTGALGLRGSIRKSKGVIRRGRFLFFANNRAGPRVRTSVRVRRCVRQNGYGQGR